VSFLFITTLFSVYTGYARLFLDGIASIYPGYSITLIGSVNGLVYGFIDVFVGVYIFAWVYKQLKNKALRNIKKFFVTILN
jgi:hypothetical protein